MRKTGHLAGHGGIPALFEEAGLRCTETAARNHPVMGRIGYYRAEKA